MNVTFEEIVLAAWLHDVGKFAQRAGIEKYKAKNMEGQLAKNQKGGWYSHQHVLYTYGFLESKKDVLPDSITVKNVIDLASYHHNPSTIEQQLISEADCLSSGSDRANLLSIDGAQEQIQFFEKPMIHLLSTLHLDQRQNIAYCKMLPLEKDAILSTDNAKISKELYKKHWDSFEQDFNSLASLDYPHFILALESLLERYWWCIPSATNTDADVSLFQHAKTTAAFAAVLYRYHETDTALSISLKNHETKKYKIISGDISGIQKYIFDLKTTENNAKLLRAKSFELLAISKILCDYIVKNFDVSSANIITFAGGKFMLLLPNTEKVNRLLPQLQLEIEEYFLKEFAGKLAVIISDGVDACYNDCMQQNAQALFNHIGYNADCCKQKKMQKALKRNGAILHEFYSKLQKNGECPQCGIFPANGIDTDGIRPCKNCEDLESIGRHLVKSETISFNSEKLQSFGDMVNFSPSRNKGKVMYSINDFKPGSPCMYLPYYAPQKQDTTLYTFEELADKSCAKEKGNKKIAMFKADVDNLGLIFSSSLGERLSFSRYADLSFTLNYFFSSYYDYFVSNHPVYKEKIYTVFSGGDDICVLGSWDAIIDFACDFHDKFEEFTNKNPDVTLSAGIVLSNAKVPVRNIADNAEKALEKSKNSTNKNSVTLFNTTVSWNEFKKNIDDGKQLQAYLDQELLTTGVVYKMIDFANRAENVNKGDLQDLLRNNTWLSNFKYSISRNVKSKEIQQWMLGFGTSPESMVKSRIAVSYALYTQRKSNR